MDYTGLAITVGIIIYGIFGYQRREKLHKQVMEYLKRDMRPPDLTPKPEAWKLVTTGSTGVLLLGMTVVFVRLALHHGRLNPATLPITLIFAALFLLVARMFVRDYATYKQFRRSGAEVKS
jgi:hypothetical protein